MYPRTFALPRSKQFSESVANVQGQISEHIFAPNGGYCVYYPNNLFRHTRSFENWGICSGISSSSWGIFYHVTKRVLRWERKEQTSTAVGINKSIDHCNPKQNRSTVS